jgi:hypothetical protein
MVFQMGFLGTLGVPRTENKIPVRKPYCSIKNNKI